MYVLSEPATNALNEGLIQARAAAGNPEPQARPVGVSRVFENPDNLFSEMASNREFAIALESKGNSFRVKTTSDNI